MVVTDFQRGHKIYYNVYKKEWRYVSDDAPAKIEKRCVRCLRYPLKDGEDYCLGHMEGVKSACCGHGVEKGFIILNDGRRFEEITYDEVKEGYEHHLSELQGLNEILKKENEQLKHELLCKQLDKAPTEPINCKCYYKELKE